MNQTIPFFDTHCDIGYDLYAHKNSQAQRLQFHLDKLKEGNCVGVNVACWIGHGESFEEMQNMVLHANKMLGSIHARPLQKGDEIHPDNNCYLLSMEGLMGIHDNPEECIDWLYDQGVRMCSLCWNEENDLATGVKGNKEHGLHPLGHRVIAQMKKRGMILDVSHMNDKSFYDALAYDIPLMASHSNCRALCNHPRNLSDEQLRELAKRDCLVGLNGTCSFVSENKEEQNSRTLAKHASRLKGIIGVDKIVVGFDFMDYFGPGFYGMISDVPCVEKAQTLFESLEAEGFTKKEIEQIAWGNVSDFLKRHIL
ncbi:MAG: membrane dipeptidase [Erysipelotrichaceae bacterium]|nr:membrane dipeptidase [Erysipelotrichaceae bacterium]